MVELDDDIPDEGLHPSPMMSTQKDIVHVEFEVFGEVQGVFFRKHTEEQAKKLGLKGWCRNTVTGTVVGVIEGESKNVEEMKKWLRETGSPLSTIEQADFNGQKKIEKFSFDNFNIRK